MIVSLILWLFGTMFLYFALYLFIAHAAITSITLFLIFLETWLLEHKTWYWEMLVVIGFLFVGMIVLLGPPALLYRLIF